MNIGVALWQIDLIAPNGRWMKVFLLPDKGMLPQIQLNEIILAPYSRLSHWANMMQFRILPEVVQQLSELQESRLWLL